MKLKLFCLLIALISILTIYIFPSNTDFIIISYNNIDSKAITKKLYNLDENEIYNKYKNFEFIKIDNVTKKKKVSYKELQNIILNSNEKGFMYGISFDENYNSFLLSEEINTNDIIDYSKGYLNLSNINKMLLKKGKLLINLPKYFYIFETESKIYDNGFIVLNNINGYNIREIKFDNIINVIDKAALSLSKMNQSNGKFKYGYYANTGLEIDDYNILRHAGSTWSLILEYKINPSLKLKETIQKSINYIIDNNLIYKDDDKVFVYEKESNEVKLGGCALTLLMLSEYTEVFDNLKYLDISKKIANAIISMQREDGSFTHVLNKNLVVKDENRTVYYDGESTFALLKLYGITTDYTYIESVEKSFDYFIINNYENYHDHWIAHSLDEYSKYKITIKYIDFAFINYTYNREYIVSLNSFNPTGLELLTATYSLYKRLQVNNKQLVANFDVNKLISDIDDRTLYLLKRVAYPEVAMYFENPKITLNSFYSKEENFRSRIDDLQHSIVGLIFYYDLFQKDG